MSANLQSRSASMSNSGEESSLINSGAPQSSLGAKTTTLRSASIGSSFFQKDASNFFISNDISNTSSHSVEDDLIKNASENNNANNVASDLDLVGALGNLDLDDDFGLPKGKKSIKKNPTPEYDLKSETTTPFQQQVFYGDNYHPFYPYPPQQQGSLTPNPTIGAFGSSSIGQNYTPSNTWSNNFIPSSAPPFSYGTNSNPTDLALSIKPFELPDGKDGDKSVSNVQLPFSNSLNFGGVLDSQLQFGFPQYNIQENNLKTEGSSSESEVEGIQTDGNQHKAGSGASLNKTSSMDYLNIGEKDSTTTGMSSIPPKDLISGQFLNDNVTMAMSNVGSLGPNMWNQHPLMATPVHLNSRNNFVENRSQTSNHFNNSGSNRYNRNRNYGNNGANIHRKLHSNNRRKGDDASKYANAKLEDFCGEIYSLCKDQHGCRFLQRQLDVGREAAERKTNANVLTNTVAATMIFNEIYLKIVELMTDPFGNYLIQKLFENVSTDQRIILVKNASPDFITIALDPHGTRALQKLVECITTEEESELITNSLAPHIVSLSRDLNGNHVVQKCLQKLKPEENQFIFDTASLHCNEIATHRHGCCVMQRCLDHGNGQQRKQLSLEVAKNATKLSLDPFGNYVVQYVLSRGDEGSIKIILDHIKSNIISLSLHKFGSNVIEKSLRISKLTDSLIDVLLENKERFFDLLNDAFGNYVLQTALDVASIEDLTKFSQALQPLLPNIKNTPHGRRILTKIQSMV